MAKISENPSEKRICTGILAHVDAGKTTLSESMLYLSGAIRKLGRVDHRDAFLDTNELERARGITIFSKQAQLSLKASCVTLLDTPGHVDFSAEMERTLQVLDYAILVVSGADGVQAHVQTLWKLLKRYEIPVFLFVNKMDQSGTDRKQILREIQEKLDERCIDFDKAQDREVFWENLAVCDEKLLERYLEAGELDEAEITDLIAERKVFPCYFGSALKLTGVAEFMEGFDCYTKAPVYPEAFGAKIYKIARDDKGVRLTHMKITGGTLKVKQLLTKKKEGNTWEEKVDQIRIYSGVQFQMVSEAPAGTVCAVVGLTQTASGEGLGIEAEAELPLLEPVLTYHIELPPELDVHATFLKLRQLEEEEPQLHLVWNEALNEIHAQVMGEVQIEILKNIIAKRFGISVEFGSGSIVYKETIAAPVEGVGHFEPLRHYAEVHLLLEPGEPGSGLQFSTKCSEDLLNRNWQRLILTHLEEKKHLGVLTGSEITDMKITLVNGKAHLKHTEGGDFRQATYRAVRQGLKSTESVLLEPIYEYRLEIPAAAVGRALSDLQKMNGKFSQPELFDDTAVLQGTAPVVCMRGYQREVTAYTKGAGRIFCTLKGYEPCHNTEEVLTAIDYDSEADLANPTGSVFCSHGAGFVVPWNEVPDYMHLESIYASEKKTVPQPFLEPEPISWQEREEKFLAGEKELEEIFQRTYGTPKREKYGWQEKRKSEPATVHYSAPKKKEKEYLLVDGYNIIFAWEELKELAELNIEAARGKLMDILSNYQGFKKNTLILVFDAYKVEGNVGEVLKYHNIHVVYTKEAETADQYIEKTVHEIGKKYQVTVATSDALEQVIILGQGARRISARGLLEEILQTSHEIRSSYLNEEQQSKNRLFDHVPKELARELEKVRLGEKSFE